jgi:SAM-dependent MidA family methyltransferase
MGKKATSVLVRHFVGSRLSTYYSQCSDAVVGSTMSSTPIPFSYLLGEWHWKRVYHQAYQRQQGHWLTPVELFKPYFSNCIANFCIASLDEQTSHGEIDLIEVGGGRGTNALLILDHLQSTRPDLYEKVRYTLVDSSPTLHKLQIDTLRTSVHHKKCHFLNKDLMDISEAKDILMRPSDHRTIVLALEVLDNLPHDKIRAFSNGKMEQIEVRRLSTSNTVVDSYEEICKPLSDPLLSRVLKTIRPQYAQDQSYWIPTVACGVLHHIYQARPHASLIVADFDWLPPPEGLPATPVQAKGEPLVTSMDGQDHTSYLTAPPLCDILFPTDFKKMATFIKQITPKTQKVDVLKQSTFLSHYGPKEIESTKSWLTGYSPLLHDFSNCSVLTVKSKI